MESFINGGENAVLLDKPTEQVDLKAWEVAKGIRLTSIVFNYFHNALVYSSV